MAVQSVAANLVWATAVKQQAGSPATGDLDSFGEKAVIAVVSAILSLIAGYVLLHLKDRREARKRLSYALMMRSVVNVDDVIAKDIAVTYKARPAERISFATCDVHNSGNTVIKDQFLRFWFGNSATVIDAYLDPQPPTEYGVDEVREDKLSLGERKFRIRHLERNQSVSFRFVVDGTIDRNVCVHPHNEAGDVDVLPRAVSRAQDDRVSLERFIFMFVLLLVLPPVFANIPDAFVRLGASLMGAILTLGLLHVLTPAARVIAEGISGGARGEGTPHITIESIQQQENAELNILFGANSPHTSAKTEAAPPAITQSTAS